MSRMKWLAWGVVLSALAMFFATGVQAQNGPNTGQSGETALRLAEPISYNNLSIFPVVSNRPLPADTSDFTTLDAALKSGDVVVIALGARLPQQTREGCRTNQGQPSASLNQLALINRGSKPLLLLAGELVKGGQQDSIITQDRIVPPGAEPLPLDIFCVVQGRSSNAGNFASGDRMVHPSVREMAAVEREQSKIWQAVLAGTAAHAQLLMELASSAALGAIINAGSNRPETGTKPAKLLVPKLLSALIINSIVEKVVSTRSHPRTCQSSLVDFFANPFSQEIQRRFEEGIAALQGESVVGVVVAYGGQVAWSDIFASPALFEQYWPKLRRSYVVEALARPQTTEQPSLDDAMAFLKPLNGDETIDSGRGPYTLRRVMRPESVELELQALRPTPIHLHTVKFQRTHGTP